MRRIGVGAVTLILVSMSCSSVGLGGSKAKAPPGGVLVHFDDATVSAEVVADTESRQLGLMHRKRLAPDAGMLFLFPLRRTSGFWMKNTLIPLQIAFMSWEGERTFTVVAILDMTPCRADPCRSYNPGRAYDAALEVTKAWFDRHGVSKGSVAEAEGELPTPI